MKKSGKFFPINY